MKFVRYFYEDFVLEKRVILEYHPYGGGVVPLLRLTRRNCTVFPPWFVGMWFVRDIGRVVHAVHRHRS